MTDSLFHQYFLTAFQWQSGRLMSGYDKMLLLIGRWPIPFDVYLIRYLEGSHISPHTDQVRHGRHYRLNLILKSPKRGGDFVCDHPLFETPRIKLFRPDKQVHSVTRVEGGSRYVLSVGWVLS
jgi:hypothetical protein